MGDSELKHKQLTAPVAHFKVLNEEEGIVEAIVSVFGNVDYAKERVMPGAFKKSLERKLPKGVWSHDWSRPIGKTLEAEELLAGDSRLPDSIKHLGGLYIKGQLNLDVQDGKDALSHLKFGSIDEFSFGYDVVQSAPAKDVPGIRDLKELEIFEWSPVLVGCNPATALIGVKDFKAEYLGEYAEADMTWAALRALNDDLFYWVIYDCLFPYDDKPMEERMATLEGALNEFAQLAIAFCRRAIVSGMDAEEMKSAVRSLWKSKRAECAQTQTKDHDSGEAPASLPFEDQLKTALAAVQGCIARAKEIQDLRAEEGRQLSEERQAQILEVKSAVEALEAGFRTKVDEAALMNLRAEFLGLELAQ